MQRDEVASWIAYSQVEPFGEQQQNIRIAHLITAVVNSNPFRRGAPLDPQDVLDSLTPPDGPVIMDSAALLEKVVSINAMVGGKDIRRESR